MWRSVACKFYHKLTVSVSESLTLSLFLYSLFDLKVSVECSADDGSVQKSQRHLYVYKSVWTACTYRFLYLFGAPRNWCPVFKLNEGTNYYS